MGILLVQTEQIPILFSCDMGVEDAPDLFFEGGIVVGMGKEGSSGNDFAACIVFALLSGYFGAFAV